MTYDFHPDPSFAYVTRKGDEGESVAALQVNLHGVLIDGRFGAQTARAVREVQAKHDLTVDGIAGVATQRAICIALSRGPSRAHGVPRGLLKSLMANESGFILAAYSPHPSDTGFDLGAYQNSVPPGQGSDDLYHHSYSVSEMAEQVAVMLDTQHNAFAHPVASWYLEHIGAGNPQRFAWQLALLNHNWPVAAEGIAERGSIYRDAEQDTIPEDWILRASGGNLSTPREWVEAYIRKATIYVNWA